MAYTYPLAKFPGAPVGSAFWLLVADDSAQFVLELDRNWSLPRFPCFIAEQRFHAALIEASDISTYRHNIYTQDRGRVVRGLPPRAAQYGLHSYSVLVLDITSFKYTLHELYVFGARYRKYLASHASIIA